MRQLLSQAIYKELMSGRVINKDTYENGEVKPNPLFEEVLNNYDQGYKPLYLNIGYELVMRNGFIYIRSSERDEEYSEVVRKIQVLLLILARGLHELGYQLDIIREGDAGVSNGLVEEIGKGEDKQDIMAASNMKGELLVSAVRKNLEQRGIAYRNAKGNLVLTQAGLAFFEDVFKYSNTEPGTVMVA